MYNARMLEHICRHPTLRDTWLASANVQTTGHDIMFTEPYRNAFTAWASADLPPASRRIVTEYWFHALKSTQRTHATAPLATLFAKEPDDTRATLRHLLTGDVTPSRSVRLWWELRDYFPLEFWVDYLTTTLARSGAGKKGAALIPVVAYDVWITTMRAHLPADTYLRGLNLFVNSVLNQPTSSPSLEDQAANAWRIMADALAQTPVGTHATWMSTVLSQCQNSGLLEHLPWRTMLAYSEEVRTACLAFVHTAQEPLALRIAAQLEPADTLWVLRRFEDQMEKDTHLSVRTLQGLMACSHALGPGNAIEHRLATLRCPATKILNYVGSRNAGPLRDFSNWAPHYTVEDWSEAIPKMEAHLNSPGTLGKLWRFAAQCRIESLAASPVLQKESLRRLTLSSKLKWWNTSLNIEPFFWDIMDYYVPESDPRRVDMLNRLLQQGKAYTPAMMVFEWFHPEADLPSYAVLQTLGDTLGVKNFVDILEAYLAGQKAQANTMALPLPGDTASLALCGELDAMPKAW